MLCLSFYLIAVASQPCAACCGMVPRDPQDPTEDQWSSECSGEGGVCTADGAAADASAEKPANAAPFQRSVSKIHYQRQVTFYPIFIEKFEEPEYGENVALYKILPPSPFNQPTPSFGKDTREDWEGSKRRGGGQEERRRARCCACTYSHTQSGYWNEETRRGGSKGRKTRGRKGSRGSGTLEERGTASAQSRGNTMKKSKARRSAPFL
eukprot:GHVT01085726.1.p1 GENE.GHVT01085726.1~~GHVT01085726.1.p1  ORF type:complete len:209 (+),score=24.28 GHVT01085726.1:268-894(+)